MILENFGIGWSQKFEKRLESLKRVFPEITFQRIERYRGMLRLDISAPNDDIQYIVDCVTYKIERESALLCERCGKHGIRRTGDERLPEPKCLCIVCYALELDECLTPTTTI